MARGQGRGPGRGKRSSRGEASAMVAQAVRRERRQLGLTIRALARQSGVATNTLSLIENGKVSPSVGTLQRVATAIGVPAAAFLQAADGGNRWTHVSQEERTPTEFPYGSLQSLGSGMANSSIEPFVLRLSPDGGSGPTPIDHPGMEFVYCLEGCIEYRLKDRPVRLEPGDSLLFEADLPHWWRNVGEGESVALLVLSPVGRHPTRRRPLRRIENLPRPSRTGSRVEWRHNEEREAAVEARLVSAAGSENPPPAALRDSDRRDHNASLIDRSDVRQLAQADWVSLKVDAVLRLDPGTLAVAVIAGLSWIWSCGTDPGSGGDGLLVI